MLHTKREYFQQAEPCLGNQYIEDSYLRAQLQRHVPKETFQLFDKQLTTFGDRVIGEILQHGKIVETNHPKLVNYNAFGRRIDEIQVCSSWTRLKDIIHEEGMVAIGYDRKYKEYSRVLQMTKIYLYSPSGGVSDCPLAMTDGASRVIEIYGHLVADAEGKEKIKKAYERLTSCDSKIAWMSGQWMTEKTGGSDVSNSQTLAVPQPDGTFKLYGYKFYTSATLSQMSLALARVTDTDGKPIKNQRLSLFYLELRNEDGNLDNILVHRLKDKLGTRGLPTAELELQGTKAHLIGEAGRGVKMIASMLNITRLYSSIGSVSAMRRAIAIARDYAHRRKVFGTLLSKTPLHLATLADMEITYRGSMAFLFDVICMYGRSEVCDNVSEEDKLFVRLLCPILKGSVCKNALPVLTEAMECLGGAGYMEDSPMPVLYRNAQVNAIWEGTTNVLSMDVWRPLTKYNGLSVFYKKVKSRLDTLKNDSSLTDTISTVLEALEKIKQTGAKLISRGKESIIEASSIARDFMLTLGNIYTVTVLLEHASWSGLVTDRVVAERWACQRRLYLVPDVQLIKEKMQHDKMLAMDVDPVTANYRGVGDILNGRIRPKF